RERFTRCIARRLAPCSSLASEDQKLRRHCAWVQLGGKLHPRFSSRHITGSTRPVDAGVGVLRWSNALGDASTRSSCGTHYPSRAALQPNQSYVWTTSSRSAASRRRTIGRRTV